MCCVAGGSDVLEGSASHRRCADEKTIGVRPVRKSDVAGCFYCQAFFSPDEISEWVDGRQPETGNTDDGVTALCPHCGIDAVLPNAIPTVLTAELLAEMHAYWF